MQKVLNVLLVDDDLLILEDLEMIIDWKAYDFNIVGCVNNGQQALEFLEINHVDIVIADIEMPKLDGLAFVKRMNCLYPNIKTILLTSFSKFDYAREAVGLGVHNYLLKHELTSKILLDNLNELREKIKQTNNLLISEDNVYFRNALHSEENLALAKIFNFNSGYGLILIKMIPLFNLKEYFQLNYQNDLMNQVLDNQIILNLKHKFSLYLLETNINEWTFGLKIDENDNYLPIEFIREIEKYVDYHKYQFIIGDIAYTTDLLKRSLDRLNNIVSKLFYQEDMIIYARDNILDNEINIDDWYEKFIKIDTINDCINTSKQFIDYLSINHPNIESSKMTIQKMLQTIHKMLGVINDHNYDRFEKWQNITNFNELEVFVKYWLNILNNSQNYSRKTSYVLHFLNMNLEKEDALDLLCQEMGMNKDYLSRLVKKECGSSLSTLLLDMRLDRAMYLLKHSNYKVYEIAEQCGFSSSQYFSIVFNKKFNIYPKDVSKERV